jgi:hypothetical protein
VIPLWTVPKVGFEPTRGGPHLFLRQARLPFRHFGSRRGDGRIRTGDRGFADPRLNHLATSPVQERKTGFEPATASLARRSATTAPLPLGQKKYYLARQRLPGSGRCGREDSNLHGEWIPRQPLKLVRLPIPPRPHNCAFYYSALLSISAHAGPRQETRPAFAAPAAAAPQPARSAASLKRQQPSLLFKHFSWSSLVSGGMSSRQ